MTYTADNIPIVDPMMVRRILFADSSLKHFVGGVLVATEYEVEDVGLADERLDFDEDSVDCSHRIFGITTSMMIDNVTTSITVFPSRRWRNHRKGEFIDSLPSPSNPLLYIGNPIRLLVGENGLTVMRSPEFIIKSGMQLGY